MRSLSVTTRLLCLYPHARYPIDKSHSTDNHVISTTS